MVRDNFGALDKDQIWEPSLDHLDQPVDLLVIHITTVPQRGLHFTKESPISSKSDSTVPLIFKIIIQDHVGHPPFPKRI